jgi:hypothetical protein
MEPAGDKASFLVALSLLGFHKPEQLQMTLEEFNVLFWFGVFCFTAPHFSHLVCTGRWSPWE